MPVSQGNYIYRMGTAPNTRVVVSQKNKVFGYSIGGAPGFKQIGVISEFSHEESRNIEQVRGVGFGDQIAELVPGVTEAMTLTLNKTLLYTANLFQVVGYKGGIDGIVRSLKHHRWPFDIKQEIVISELSSRDDATGAPNAQAADNVVGISNSTNYQDIATPITNVLALFTFYEGCWLNSYSASYTSDAAIVAENGQATVTDIIDGVSQYGEFVDTGLAPVSANGQAGMGYSLRFANNSNLAPTTVP